MEKLGQKQNLTVKFQGKDALVPRSGAKHQPGQGLYQRPLQGGFRL